MEFRACTQKQVTFCQEVVPIGSNTKHLVLEELNELELKSLLYSLAILTTNDRFSNYSGHFNEIYSRAYSHILAGHSQQVDVYKNRVV